MSVSVSSLCLCLGVSVSLSVSLSLAGVRAYSLNETMSKIKITTLSKIEIQVITIHTMQQQQLWRRQ